MKSHRPRRRAINSPTIGGASIGVQVDLLADLLAQPISHAETPQKPSHLPVNLPPDHSPGAPPNPDSAVPAKQLDPTSLTQSANSSTKQSEIQSTVQSAPNPIERPQQWWLCIRFATLALDLFDADPKAGPVFIVETINQRQFIHSACRSAHEQGVSNGMPLNAAYTLCHQPQVGLRDEKKERKWLERTARYLYRFTPKVSLAAPDALLLEISGSGRLFGNIKELYRSIRDIFRDRALVCLSPAPTASLLLTRTGHTGVIASQDSLHRALSPIHIQHLGLGEKRSHKIQRCGIHQLGDLWRLPRADLARRFGKDITQTLNELTGDMPSPRTFYQPLRSFSKTVTFPDEHNDRPTLVIAAQSLIHDAESCLQQHASVTETMRFSLHHAAKYGEPTVPPTLITIRVQTPSRQCAHFLPQFETRLEHLQLGYQVTAISLNIDQFIENSQPSADLFEQKSHLQEWAHLLDLIRARIGDKNVYGIQSNPDHRPEYAWSRRDAGTQNKVQAQTRAQFKDQAKNPIPEPFLLPRHRPLWICRQPKTIPPPRSNPCVHQTERIEGGWWDGDDIRRDYQIDTQASGVKAWIYRDLSDNDPSPPHPAPKQSNWYLHGLFG